MDGVGACEVAAACACFGIVNKGDILHIVMGPVTSLIGIVDLSAAIQGFLINDLNILERAAIFTVPFFIIYPTLMSNVIGVAIVAGIYLLQKVRLKTAAAS